MRLEKEHLTQMVGAALEDYVETGEVGSARISAKGYALSAYNYMSNDRELDIVINKMLERANRRQDDDTKPTQEPQATV